MSEWTRRDKWMARLWPFLVLRKIDKLVEANNEIDNDATWRRRLTSPEAQQAALRIGNQESARVERLEDKLDRQQPVAALLIPIATALFAAAWFSGYPWIVATAILALVAASFALFTAAWANVPFEHHTLTAPELGDILGKSDDIGAEVAARAITDSQRNIPRGTHIQNRVGAVRHAIFTSLTLIVLSAMLFAAPNWDTAGDRERADAVVLQRLESLRGQADDIAASVEDRTTRDERLHRELNRIRRAIRRIQDQLRR